jgi:hypothetical protein
MRRVSETELNFYDGLANRITRALGDPACALTESGLANRIGWHRARLCNFLNRTDKTIPAHFLPGIARAFRLSIDELMGSGAAAPEGRTSWDPRTEDAEVFIDKLRGWRDRYLPNVRLHDHLPPVLLPRRGMIANYVNSIFDGCFPAAAGRWHDLIDAQARLIIEGGEGDVVNLISYTDLLKLPHREYPFQHFSHEDVLYVLETLKRNWIRRRDFVLIVFDDSVIAPEAKLELSCNSCVGAVGQETRIEYGNDLRVRWKEDGRTAGATYESLLGVKRSAGFGPRERPSVQQGEQLIDDLLRRMDRAALPLPRRHVA